MVHVFHTLQLYRAVVLLHFRVVAYVRILADGVFTSLTVASNSSMSSFDSLYEYNGVSVDNHDTLLDSHGGSYDLRNNI
jgi:hypothetical protein